MPHKRCYLFPPSFSIVQYLINLVVILQVCANWSNINNTIVGGYQLVGAGKEFTAFHKETKVVKTCQVCFTSS